MIGIHREQVWTPKTPSGFFGGDVIVLAYVADLVVFVSPKFAADGAGPFEDKVYTLRENSFRSYFEFKD